MPHTASMILRNKVDNSPGSMATTLNSGQELGAVDPGLILLAVDHVELARLESQIAARIRRDVAIHDFVEQWGAAEILLVSDEAHILLRLVFREHEGAGADRLLGEAIAHPPHRLRPCDAVCDAHPRFRDREDPAGRSGLHHPRRPSDAVVLPRMRLPHPDSHLHSPEGAVAKGCSGEGVAQFAKCVFSVIGGARLSSPSGRSQDQDCPSRPRAGATCRP